MVLCCLSCVIVPSGANFLFVGNGTTVPKKTFSLVFILSSLCVQS